MKPYTNDSRKEAIFMDTAEFWQSFQDTLPALVKGVILILIAWLVAVLVKNVVTK
jgi:hypothetical protein